jgi:glycosyltransferase involved in cell wall biosynthesis
VRIVSIAPFMPFQGIPHAGGEFYRRHAELASRSHDFLIVSPKIPENETAMAESGSPPYARLLVPPRAPRGRPGRLFSYVLSRAVPFLAVRPFYRALLEDQQALFAMRRADRIELQWFNAVVLAPKLRRAFPGTPIVGVFHDIVSQGQARMLYTRGVALRWRLLALAQFVFAVPMERRVMRSLDTAVVLSEKDRALLARRGGTAGIVVVSPPLDDEDMPRSPRLDPPDVPEVLFVGALWRVENEDAAQWLLREIWPKVVAAVPAATLTIAGAEPSPALRREAERHGSVRLTGYVKSLGPYYERASVVVAPMRLGAGVKLKSVVAMLWGLPVVATRVGAEGVSGPQVFLAVEDHSESFAKALIGVLKDPASARDVRDRAYRWSHDTYSPASYLRSLDRVYS